MEAKLFVDLKAGTTRYHRERHEIPRKVKVVLSPTGKHAGTIQRGCYTTVRNPSTILEFPEGHWEPSIAIETPLIEEFIKRKDAEEIYYKEIGVGLIEIKLENKKNNSDRSRKMWKYTLNLCPDLSEDTNLITFWARPEEFKNTVSRKGGKTTEQRYIPLKQLVENREKVGFLNG